MLTETQEKKIRERCTRCGLHVGTLRVRADGVLIFESLMPIKENVMKVFPTFRLENEGVDPIYEERTDDMRYAHWVTMRPDTE